jgi:hypothetical protein
MQLLKNDGVLRDDAHAQATAATELRDDSHSFAYCRFQPEDATGGAAAQEVDVRRIA